MTLRSILAGALLCVLFASNADARPRHGHHHYRAEPGNSNLQENLAGCSDPICEIFSVSPSLPTARAAHRKGHRRTPSPGLRRVMAEGAARAANWIKPRAWCGWWMRRHLGVANPAGNRARWWAGYGRPAHGPRVGAIVVWRHHVGKITGRTADGRWIVKSGNDGHRVRERPRSVAGAIAFRWPA